jgi:hypothetical protein
MRIASALALALASLASVPASAHDRWARPVVVVDDAVWVNPGVYVSQYSGVTRNYPYVGCCLPAYENWSYMRPYSPAFGSHTSRIALPRYSHRSTAEEPPRAVDHCVIRRAGRSSGFADAKSGHNRPVSGSERRAGGPPFCLCN